MAVQRVAVQLLLLLFCARLAALARGTRLGAGDPALALAVGALAADRLQIAFEIVRAVVVGDLLARLDGLDRADIDLPVARLDVGLRIRPAAVVGVARDVAADGAVDGPAPVQLEQVLVFDGVVFLDPAVEQRAGILDDPRTLLDFPGSEETKSGAGAADAIRLAGRNGGHDTQKTGREHECSVLLVRFLANATPFAQIAEPSPNWR